MTKETVYSFMVWNQQTGSQQRAPRKATKDGIKQIDGVVLEETAEIVDSARLDGNGFLVQTSEKE